jgi:GT2 family glycosyltransferase
MYRKAALQAVGGFDERYASYDACDLHTRLSKSQRGAFYFEPRAVVLHRHRTSWKEYWRQQFAYGIGYAQFILHHRTEVRWSARQEIRALADLTRLSVGACLPANGDVALLRRGTLIKKAAQHAGFVSTYWRPGERKRW